MTDMSQGYRIKPLVWGEWAHVMSCHTWNELFAMRTAKSVLGPYYIGRKRILSRRGFGEHMSDDWWVEAPRQNCLLGPFKNDIEARTAAQADYEARIAPAIEPTGEMARLREENERLREGRYDA
ncbi:hypothetical protein [Rhodovulum sulfidophilum]|uniref:hypothetical protein n=2 Tax=Rhodovulum sulfidophilum TaxID=35806 RepID=UPI001179B2A5|nr:hypothetical protein [Rhodovulum sulfidophilum]MBL3554540.1 hypothetical protein [Rhodovulum sulfidophilum]MBL3576406.1 hypothetical protein [Rhodovulum sulfidophilum]MCE8433859.1 hypothetical protein [Rhodovulum sulfidophilum]MCF4118610.1 hypothetical protein [Rhodovulum sulfidophilum]